MKVHGFIPVVAWKYKIASPLFEQVAQFQLPEMTLLFTVFNKKGMKRKETIGWFSMGLSNSSEEEIGHWNEMRESKGHQVCRWHALLES